MRFPGRKQQRIRKKAYTILAGLGGLVLAGGILAHFMLSASADPARTGAENSTFTYYTPTSILDDGVEIGNRKFASFELAGPEAEGMNLVTNNEQDVAYSPSTASDIYASKTDTFFYKSDLQWPRIQYTNEGTLNEVIESESGSQAIVQEMSNTRVTEQVSQMSYYLISDDGVSITDLQREFFEYVSANSDQYQNMSILNTDADNLNNFMFYNLTNSTVVRQAAETAFQDFMDEKGASVYLADEGVSLSDCDYGEDYVVTLISGNIQTFTWQYLQYVYSPTSLNDPMIYQAIPMISLTNYPVQMKSYYEELPQVVSADGNSAGTYYEAHVTEENVNTVLKDTSVAMEYPLNLPENVKDNYELQYYLTATDYSIDAVRQLNRWWTFEEGEAISLSSRNLSGTKRYLYVMLKEKSGNDSTTLDYQYTDGVIGKYDFVLETEQPSGDIVLQSTNLESTGIDVNETATLTINNENAMLLYTLDGTYPELIRYQENLTGEPTIAALDERVTGELGTVFIEDDALSSSYNYLRANGYWYYCAKSVKRYSEPILTDESVRTNNRLLVRVRAIEDGKELGSYVSKTLAFQLGHQVETPTSDPLPFEGDGTTVTTIAMGSRVNFSCVTEEAELFYTTNGSAPIVALEEQNGQIVTVPGNSSTIKGNYITVTETFAAYESNVTLMVKAVRYENGVRTMRDSEVARLVFQVGDVSPVESVTAYPTTDNSEPTELAAGQTVQLSCTTANTIIYYTVDGTEPQRNSDGTYPANTFVYTGGIVVPEQTDSLFTVTAMAYAQGLATSDITRFIYKYPDALAAPYATPGSGSVTENTEVSLRSSSTGAIIYYEIAYNGEEAAEPTTSSNIYDESNPILINTEMNIKAIAVLGNVTSTIGEFDYTVSSKLEAPTPSVESGSVISNGSSITLSAADGAMIYYTTDGSNPTDSANTMVNVGKTIFLSGDAGSVITIRTYAAMTGYSSSETVTYSYTISNYENAIFADRETGSVLKNGDRVMLNTDVTDAVIYYTLDGSMPTTFSSQGNAVVISGASGSTVVLKAIAVFSGGTRTTSVATFTYTITEQLKAVQSNIPSGAVFTERGEIVLSAEGGTIYYTTDGSTPTSSSNVFQSSIPITRGVTIKAVAISEDADDSPVSTFTYQFADAVAEPTASVERGQVDIGTEVTLSCDTADATIYYTVNGTDPDTSNLGVLQTYSSPIVISRAMTLKAVAVKSGMQDSTVMTVGYTVKEPVIVETDTESTDESADTGSSTGRLKSRRTYEGSVEGPLFKDIILKNATYGVIVSAKFDVIPENSALTVTPSQYGSSVNSLVKQNIGSEYAVVSAYDVEVAADSEDVEPDGELEIGIPIPAAYENSLIYMIYMAEDGSIEVQETRRSGGMAYATVTHLSEYAIVAPQIETVVQSYTWIYILIGAIIVIAGVAVWFIRRRNRYYDV